MDTLILEDKVTDLLFFLQSFNTKLPSYRKAKSEIYKLKKTTKDFQRKYPASIARMVPAKELARITGQDKHQLHRQSEGVDRAIRKLIEEEIISTFGSLPGGSTITANKVRSDVQKRVEEINQHLHKRHQANLKARLKVLGLYP